MTPTLMLDPHQFTLGVLRDRAHSWNAIAQRLLDMGLSEPDAGDVMRLYTSRGVKAIRVNRRTGCYELTHGAFFDPDVIRRALEMARA